MERPASSDTREQVGLVYGALGIYAWDYFGTLWFEWLLLTRRLTFKPFYIPYFIGRYCLWALLINMAVMVMFPNEHTCISAQFSLNLSMASVTIVCASASMALRVFAIWDRRKCLLVLFAVMLGVQLCLGLRGINATHVKWMINPFTQKCMTFAWPAAKMGTFYVYTIGFDLTTLVLSVVGLLRRKSSIKSRLWDTLFRHGLVYFVVTLCAHVVPAVIDFTPLAFGTPLLIRTWGVLVSAMSVITSTHMTLSLVKHIEPDAPAAFLPEGCSGTCPVCCRPAGSVEFTSVFVLPAPSMPPASFVRHSDAPLLPVRDGFLAIAPPEFGTVVRGGLLKETGEASSSSSTD